MAAMDEQDVALTSDEAMELLAFLTTSAQGCFKEPSIYGIYRLVSAAIQLAEFWRPRASSETVAVLDELIAEGQRQANILSNDPQDFKAFLVEINVALANEIKRQAQ
jgi:hypothetical protein